MQSSVPFDLRLCCATAVVLIATSGFSWPAWASSSSVNAALQAPYPYLVVEQNLRDVLQAFRHNLGIATVISDRVGGVVRSGTQEGETAASFLRRLSDAHDLVWYVDSDTLFISTLQENMTQTLAANRLGSKRREAIAKVWSDKGVGVHVASDKTSHSLVVTGPAGFRQRVASVIAAVEPTPTTTGEGKAVTVFRGTSGSQRVTVMR